jgi:ankyrin repeat protein
MDIGIALSCIWLIFLAIFYIQRVFNSPIAKIHQAVLDGNIEVVRECLEKGVNADLRQNGGISSLCLATTNNQQEIAELLISYGADINQGLNEEDGVNPLLGAAIGNHLQLVEILLYRGAVKELHFATLYGDIDAVMRFLERQPSQINSKRNRGMTPLHLAAIGGHREIAEYLLNNGAMIDFFTPASKTPLHQAVIFNHLQLVGLLLDRGADPNRALALLMATCKNNYQMVELLVMKGIDINYQDDAGYTALHRAATENNFEIAELLLANGARANIKTRTQFKTPLHNAADKGHLQMVQLLLSNGADLNSIGGLLPMTPLDEARSSGHIEVVKLLENNGAIGSSFFER